MQASLPACRQVPYPGRGIPQAADQDGSPIASAKAHARTQIQKMSSCRMMIFLPSEWKNSMGSNIFHFWYAALRKPPQLLRNTFPPPLLLQRNEEMFTEQAAIETVLCGLSVKGYHIRHGRLCLESGFGLVVKIRWSWHLPQRKCCRAPTVIS